METPPHKQGPRAGPRVGLELSQEAGGPEWRPQGPLPAEREGHAGEAPPGRAPGGPPPSRRGARAPPEVKTPKPPQRVAVGGTRSDRCSGPQRAGGGGEQLTICNLPERVRIADAPPGDSRPGEEGTQETRPQETWRRKGPGQHPGVGQTGTSMGARKKSESKVKVFRIGLESEGAAKDTAHMPLQKLPTRNACNVSTTLARVNSQSLSCKRHDGATTVQICAICR